MSSLSPTSFSSNNKMLTNEEDHVEIEPGKDIDDVLEELSEKHKRIQNNMLSLCPIPEDGDNYEYDTDDYLSDHTPEPDSTTFHRSQKKLALTPIHSIEQEHAIP